MNAFHTHAYYQPAYSQTRRKLENPILQAIQKCKIAERFMGSSITADLLQEIGVVLSKATGCQCLAYHEAVLVPAEVGMVCVSVKNEISGQTWKVTAGRIPQ